MRTIVQTFDTSSNGTSKYLVEIIQPTLRVLYGISTKKKGKIFYSSLQFIKHKTLN